MRYELLFPAFGKGAWQIRARVFIKSLIDLNVLILLADHAPHLPVVLICRRIGEIIRISSFFRSGTRSPWKPKAARIVTPIGDAVS
jgi:hypothetical protein